MAYTDSGCAHKVATATSASVLQISGHALLQFELTSAQLSSAQLRLRLGQPSPTASPTRSPRPSQVFYFVPLSEQLTYFPTHGAALFLLPRLLRLSLLKT